ncbi:hypothetical protein L837_3537 [Mycobacterium avium MAV_061107_1842]|nr:hypothetical protein L837_3537 [Mycobacterium avium MAV_061107_1842]
MVDHLGVQQTGDGAASMLAPSISQMLGFRCQSLPTAADDGGYGA